MNKLIKIQDIEKEYKVNGVGIKFTDDQIAYFNNTKLNLYSPPIHHKQFTTLLTKVKSPIIYFRLCQLLSKFIHTWDYSKLTYALLKNKYENDISMFKILFNVNKKESDVYEFSKKYLGDYYANIIKTAILNKLTELNKVESILDIGCGDCILTKYIGESLNAKHIYGADIEKEFEIGWEKARPTDITFVTIKHNILKFNRKFDAICCIMVMHHIPEHVLQDYLESIHQYLNKGGLFLIKEHDCFNSIDYMMADIEHSLYIANNEYNRNNLDVDSWFNRIDKEPLINYKDRFTWNVLISRVGFECIYENVFDTRLSNIYTPTKGYVALFKKK